MNPLDDSGLRVQLDRRVQSSPLGPDEREEILGAVAAARTAPHRANLWSGGRWLGFAAAALSVILVAVVISKLPTTEPPAATTPPTSFPAVTESPASIQSTEPPSSEPRIFSAQELSDMIGGPRVGEVVLAQARIGHMMTGQVGCQPPEPCDSYVLDDVSGSNVVAAGWRDVPEGEGTRYRDDSGVRWLTPLSVPAEPGLFAFKVLAEAAEYLGPVVETADGEIVWNVGDVKSGEHNDLTDDLYAVEGWLVQTPPVPCPAPSNYGPDTTMAYWCGGSFITKARVETYSPGPGVLLDPGGLHVQGGAYEEFALTPVTDAQRGGEPRLGTYLVRSAGCQPVTFGDCPVWSMVGRLEPPMAPAPLSSGLPAEIDGEPVLTPPEALERARNSDSDAPFLVGGWIVYTLIDCVVPDFPPDFPTPLLAPCNDGFLMTSEPPTRQGEYFGTAVRLVVDEDVGWFPTGQDATVLRVHAHDARAADCPPTYKARCDEAIVVDELAWSEIPPPAEATPAVIDLPPLAIGNSTTLPVSVAVNGKDVARALPGQFIDPIDPRLLPALPWDVHAMTSTGRVLLTLHVEEGDVWRATPDPNGASEMHGAAARVDLSCGRLDIWSGPPLAGPPPPSNFASDDCKP